MPTGMKKKEISNGIKRGSSLKLISPYNKIKLINYENFSLLIAYMFIKNRKYVENITYEFNLIYMSFRREMYKSE